MGSTHTVKIDETLLHFLGQYGFIPNYKIAAVCMRQDVELFVRVAQRAIEVGIAVEWFQEVEGKTIGQTLGACCFSSEGLDRFGAGK